MSQIDPARISRILRTLSAPGSAAERSQGPATSAKGSTPSRNSPAVLKSRIHNRLACLSEDDLRRDGPTITVQEVLRWEFGDDILNNSGFTAVARKVTAALLGDHELSVAISRLVDQLAGKQ